MTGCTVMSAAVFLRLVIHILDLDCKLLANASSITAFVTVFDGSTLPSLLSDVVQLS